MIAKMFTLPVREQITPSLTRRQQGELDILVVDHTVVHAAIALQGAHLLCWKPQGEEDVLWLSENSAFAHGKAIRGGVPLCWPWFGPAAKEGLPAHGFARNMLWSLKAHHETDDGVTLTLELKDNEESRRLWPHAFTLLAHFRLGECCEITLEAHGEFETTAALHSYFNVGDSGRVTVSGLGTHYLDKVAGGKGTLTDGVQAFPDRIDRVYLEPQSHSQIHDPSIQRIIDVAHHHHSNVVGWNPGPALSASMADVPDAGYKTFVCVETAAISVMQKANKAAPSRLAATFRIIK